MAKRKRKKTRARSASSRRRGRSRRSTGSSKSRRRVPTCCECPSTAARKAFKKARSCSEKERALTEINRLLNEDAHKLKPGAVRLLRMDVAKKIKQTADFCAREEQSDVNRFNGLGRWR